MALRLDTRITDEPAGLSLAGLPAFNHGCANCQIEIAPPVDRHGKFHERSGYEPMILAAQLPDQLLESRIVSDQQHRAGRFVVDAIQDADDVVGRGVIQRRFDDELACVAGSAGHGFRRRARANGVRRDDEIRNARAILEPGAGARRIAFAAMVERPVPVVNRVAGPARFGVPENQQSLHATILRRRDGASPFQNRL